MNENSQQKIDLAIDMLEQLDTVILKFMYRVADNNTLLSNKVLIKQVLNNRNSEQTN